MLDRKNLRIRISNNLPEDARIIREAVFQIEQGFTDEFDAIDEDVNTIHMVIYNEGKPIGTCRHFKENDAYRIGRLAVVKEYRGQGIGEYIVLCAEKEIFKRGGQEVVLSAQVRARGFYEKIGYRAEGDIYMDEDCPHIGMRKVLEG